MLASEYGWAKDDILNTVYVDDVFYLREHIKRRHFEDWKMQLAIVQNPHTKNPKDLWDMLSAETNVPADEKLDKEGFEAFKRALAGSQRVQVK